MSVDENESGAIRDGRDLDLVVAIVFGQFNKQIDAGFLGVTPFAFEQVRAGGGIAELPTNNGRGIQTEAHCDFAPVCLCFHRLESGHGLTI